MKRASVAFVLWLLACGTPSQPSSASATQEPSTAPLAEPSALPPSASGNPAALPQAPAPAPVVATNAGVDTRRAHATAAAPHACVLDRPLPSRVWATPGAASVAARHGSVWVTGYATDDHGVTNVYVVSVNDEGHASPLYRATLAGSTGDGSRIRTAAPRLLPLSTGRLLLLAVDGRGALLATLLDASLPTAGGAMRPIAEHVDLRFPPAVAEFSEHLFISYTDGSATPMRAFLITTDLVLNGAMSRDLTPAGMGGASPVWFPRENGSTLLFVDAHGGLSPLVSTDAEPGGATSEVRVERALSTIAEPAQIAAASIGRDAYVAYVAIGRAATSAVGLVKLGNNNPPVAIVPGIGYGSSHVSAVSLGHGIVFAADAPPPPDSHAARHLVLRAFDQAGLGEALNIASPEPGANYIDIAAVSDNDVQIVWTTDAAVYVTSAHCSLL